MSNNLPDVLAALKGGLIVSCQALEDEPLYGSDIMAAMAKAAYQGGAAGIRANTGPDIRAIKEACPLPVIGIVKRTYPNSDIYITPTMAEVREVADAGAELVAIDSTNRPRPDGLMLRDLYRQVRAETNLIIVADVSTYEEGVAAQAAGADIISTTMSGYTPYSRAEETPDFELVARLSANLAIPVIAEGRIWTPQEACAALDAGAFAVVVGTAITRPQEIVRRYVQKIGTRSQNSV